MNIHKPTTTMSIVVPQCSWRVMLALLCLFSAMSADAAEPFYAPSTTLAAQPLFSLLGLKERLFRLRDFTVGAIAPLHGSLDANGWNSSATAADQFDARHQLFKSLGQESPSETVTRLENQRWGIEVRTNLLFQYDLTRYRTAEDGQQVGVKLGLHYEFR